MSELKALWEAFDALYAGIISVCQGCTDHDCEGFVYLLAEEADTLYDKGVPLVVINDSLSFIHSFEERDGEILVDRPKPPCVLRCEGRCSIYELRPLVCRMYPVGLSMEGGEVTLVMFRDCRFARELIGPTRQLFFDKVKEILRSASPDVLRALNNTFAEVYEISAFPNGQNAVEVICPLNELVDWR
jgi:Fe-S-cluster containining protein